jgi:cytochrome c-type protein NapB
MPVPGQPGREKSTAQARAARRAFDGAPPTVPHESFGMDCISCHNLEGLEVPDVGFAPAQPHALTLGMSAVSRCAQCHVFALTSGTFVENRFFGRPQDLRRGHRLNTFAPPVIPHGIQMRENCLACHAGPAAREEIRTSHAERVRCRQCHVPQVEDGEFSR